jgi:hypothetical protein
LETARLVTAIAEWLILALPAAAQLDQSATAEIELPAVLIEQLEITLDVDTSVALHGHPC